MMRQVLLLLAVCSAVWVCAQKDTSVVRSKALMPVDVTVPDVPSSVASTIPLQTMRQMDFQLAGMSEVAQSIRHFAGVGVRDYGGIGGLRSVNIRNLGVHHTAVSYDGFVLTNMQAGQIDIGRFATDNVAAVTLSVGDGRRLLQSARHYASGGVIEIETNDWQTGRWPSGWEAELTAGSFGRLRPRLKISERLSRRTSISLQGIYERADGNYPYTLYNSRRQTKERRRNSDVESWQGEANLVYTFRDSSLLRTKISYYYSERGLPGSVVLYNNSSTECLWDEQTAVQADYTKRFSRQWQLRSGARFAHTWNRYIDVDVKYPEGRQVDINRQNEYYLTSSVAWIPFADRDTPLQSFALALAEDLSVNTLSTNIGYMLNPRRLTSLTALSAQWSSYWLTLKANAVATVTDEHLRNGAPQVSAPTYAKRLNPSVSFSLRLLPRAQLFLRGMMKKTFRLPTFTDLYYQRMGNHSLRPEQAREWNLGVGYECRLAGCELRLTADGYINRVEDKIVAFPTTYLWKTTNFGHVDIKGLDLTMSLSTQLGKNIHLRLHATSSWQNAVDKTDSRSVSYSKQLPYTPSHYGSALLTLQSPWLSVGYSVFACGERFSMPQCTDEYRLRPYQEHSLTLSRDLRLSSVLAKVSLSVLNLFDKQYEVVQYYPMPGRMWQLHVVLTKL
ncbi:MAG: TonB-dependent receptor [Prevotella sp.]|nr:TonB-dependent receptor [Prevotella sp.]